MKIKSTLALTLLAFALTPAIVRGQEPTAPATSETALTDAFAAGYADLSTALYKDDLEAAKKAAESIAALDKEPAASKHAKAIADSKSLDEARLHFKELSAIAIAKAKTDKGLMMMQEAHCPMAMGGKGASWLQKDASEVQNPYMGAKMPHCGEMKK